MLASLWRMLHDPILKVRARRKLPFLRDFDAKSSEIIGKLKPYWQHYVAEVSTPRMAVSLETASFLWILCEGLRVETVLDLGSGFSSFVVRYYTTFQSDITVWSVDDSPEWLERTREYLGYHGLPAQKLVLWDQLKLPQHVRFDLVFHDLGRMNLRQNSFNRALHLVKEETGVILLDDMHKSSFAKYVHNTLTGYPSSYFDLRPYVLDDFGRYSGLITNLELRKNVEERADLRER